MSRVLLIYHNALFAHSIHIALRSASCIHLVGELEDWTRLEAEIARLAPDVVLVEEDEDTATDAVLGMLRARQSPWRVVALRLDETTMHIWSGAGKALRKPQDLHNALCAVPGRQRKILHTARRATLTRGGQ
jgi:DNA-binding NarL/FixJ family response regulator